MEHQKEHFSHILLFYFRKGKNALQAHKKLCAVYGDEASKERQCVNWFAKFRSGDFSLKDEECSGRPAEVDDDLIKAIIDSNRHTLAMLKNLIHRFLMKETIQRNALTTAVCSRNVTKMIHF
ncbi:hypothetical protein COOONC_00539 [Cooperia oncophora]